MNVSAQIHTSGPGRPARSVETPPQRASGRTPAATRRWSTPARRLGQPTRAVRAAQPVGQPAPPAPPARPSAAAGRACSATRGRTPAGVLLVQRLRLVRRHVDAGRAVADAQPLQDRQRSSASCTAGSARPCTSEPSSASWSTRARPRVESFSSRVARYDGHITPPVVGATHLPTPVQRCTASPSDPPSCVSRSAVATVARGRAGRRSASSGAGSTSTPGLSRLSGSQIALTAPNSAQRLLVVHQRQQLRARPPVAVLARQRAAVRRAARSRTGDQELAERRRPPSSSKSKSIRTCTQPSPKWPYGTPSSPCSSQQLVEVAQPGAEPLGRDGRVLPAGVRRPVAGCGRRARRRPRGSATARPPRPASSTARRSSSPAAGHRRRPRRHLDEQPAGAARAASAPRSRRRAPGRRSGRPAPRRRPAAGPRPAAPAPRRRPRPSTGSRAPPAAAARRRPADRRLEHDAEGALGADQEPVEAPAVLGQQVLERVAADLPREPPERVRTCAEVPVDQAPSAASRDVRLVAAPVRHAAARRRCRRSGRSPAPASRRRCCRSSRRSCSGCASTGPGRSAARAARPPAAGRRARRRAGRRRCAPRGRPRRPGSGAGRCRRRCPGRPRCRRSTYRRRAW